MAELATHWAEASAGGDPTQAIELAIHAGDLAADREATVYKATTMMALARETGTLADLGFLADLTEEMGHPASAARALSVYIRLTQGDVDRGVPARAVGRASILDLTAWPAHTGSGEVE